MSSRHGITQNIVSYLENYFAEDKVKHVPKIKEVTGIIMFQTILKTLS